MPCVPTATNSCSIDAAGCLWFSACRPSRALIFSASCMFFAAGMLRILSRMLVAFNADARSKSCFRSLHSSRPDLVHLQALSVVDFIRASKAPSTLPSRNDPVTVCSAESTSMSNLPLEQHFPVSSYDNFWSVIQLLSKYLMSSLMDLPVQAEAVLRLLGPGLEVAGHLHGGALLPSDVFHLASSDGPDESSRVSCAIQALELRRQWSPELLRAPSALAEAVGTSC